MQAQLSPQHRRNNPSSAAPSRSQPLKPDRESSGTRQGPCARILHCKEKRKASQTRREVTGAKQNTKIV